MEIRGDLGLIKGRFYLVILFIVVITSTIVICKTCIKKRRKRGKQSTVTYYTLTSYLVFEPLHCRRWLVTHKQHGWETVPTDPSRHYPTSRSAEYGTSSETSFVLRLVFLTRLQRPSNKKQNIDSYNHSRRRQGVCYYGWRNTQWLLVPYTTHLTKLLGLTGGLVVHSQDLNPPRIIYKWSPKINIY